MTTAATISVRDRAYVEAVIKYPERAAEGGNISGNKEFTFGLEDHVVRVHNARLADVSFERSGFCLLRRPTDFDLSSREEAEARWHPEACRLVRELTGARDVFPLLGILRGGEEDLGGGPALMAHVDFDGETLRSWVGRLAPPDRADELKRRRLVNINLWTPVRPVENMPLGVCDAASVEPGDFMKVSFGKPGEGEGPQSGGFVLAYNPRHRWCYFPDMQPHEVLAFRLHDTGDPDLRMTAHTAFEDPTSRPGAPKRMSYELRTIAVLD